MIAQPFSINNILKNDRIYIIFISKLLRIYIIFIKNIHKFIVEYIDLIK